MKRVIIVHGWGGKPEHGWYLWLAKKLEEHGFEVELPQLPDTDYPRIENWIPALAKTIGKPDANTFLVGHSMGCQTIARYLENLPDGEMIGGAVFIAGFFKHLNDNDYEKDDLMTEKHWLTRPLDFNKVKAHMNKSYAIFSEDDPDVPLDNKEDFEKYLNSKIIVLNGYQHFREEDGIKELPIALEKILELSQ